MKSSKTTRKTIANDQSQSQIQSRKGPDDTNLMTADEINTRLPIKTPEVPKKKSLQLRQDIKYENK